ncbi:hypothetical protein QVO10_06030 [Bacteroides gallinaceum]|jgi:NADH:ubiquinone oxidoreductase subunit 2 (subunit N)|uniref:Uncharacterized protein n=1 Tax=Bacteroides gallinaceum TaxID=1462571 RepID=A0ABT7X4G4_9BACE|nr:MULTISPECIES: hypothetical protein [Bacteroidaceae]CCZ70542.1 putative uncharacterized protein [Bacteroides sp. CAG:702]MBM6659294.1 hypothetical protein [Bacteroides gallinaceum]MBM6945525.1 hypothetical protein [Bacteroides gallinaceum]MDN0048947.1 hypothetical protein [Bacteroides gallinaceum]MDN0066833.1 hypothetical protein [Bacteroides gallinaceum]
MSEQKDKNYLWLVFIALGMGIAIIADNLLIGLCLVAIGIYLYTKNKKKTQNNKDELD